MLFVVNVVVFVYGLYGREGRICMDCMYVVWTFGLRFVWTVCTMVICLM